jgi:hypothetical protein
MSKMKIDNDNGCNRTAIAIPVLLKWKAEQRVFLTLLNQVFTVLIFQNAAGK